MCGEADFSEAEWELIVELLERERAELPIEIRHTRTSNVRDNLRGRAEMVKRLLGRMEHHVAAK